jgi:hypothetical protein
MRFNPFFDTYPEDGQQFTLANISYVPKNGWLTVGKQSDHKKYKVPRWKDSPWIFLLKKGTLFGCHCTQTVLKPIGNASEYLEEYKSRQLDYLKKYNYSIMEVNE